MSGSAADGSIDRLVAHRDFVRRLARSLVRDAHDADDLEQEVWLTALRRPPAHESQLRGWFRRVARSRSIDRSRGDARRAELARRVGDVDRAPSACELAERLDAGRRVAAAVARLDEPYRGTILLRFYDDIAPTEIAARTGVPVETVRTRLRRAIERLRDELDREGGRGAWMAAALPFVVDGAPHGAAGGAATTIGGGVVMGAKLTIAAAAASAVLASVVTVKLVQADRPVEGPPADGEEAAQASEIQELRRRVDAVEARATRLAQQPRADERNRAQEERVAALETTVADLQKRAAAPPATPGPAKDGATDAQKMDEITERLRRIVADSSQPEAKRLEAIKGLRGIPSGFTIEVIRAVGNLYRSSQAAATRESILRDLHNVRDEALLPEVRSLYVAGLSDTDETVRRRAAGDADTFVSDPSVRQALEAARDGDASEAVRARAARTLEPRTPK